jgi:hypothetical protein
MPDGDKSSRIKGWIVGYKLHMWYQDGSIGVVPLSAAYITIANVQDN